MYENELKKFTSLYEKLSYKYDKSKVFYDFVKMSAIAIYNAFAKNQEMEKEYLRVINSYEKEYRDIFPQILGELIMSYEKESTITDLLGPFYERENMGNSHLGQFFTPAHISDIMAEINVGSTDKLQEIINKSGYITVNDPCCGAGRNVAFICKSNAKKRYQLSTKFISYSK